MEHKVEGCNVFVRLHKGEDFMSGLKEACEKAGIQSAAVATGIGMLENAELGYFKGVGDYEKELLEKPHELVSLQGIILKQGGEFNFHLHAALANESHELLGGHLFAAKVAVTAELMLIKSEAVLKRELEQETGLMGLKLG